MVLISCAIDEASTQHHAATPSDERGHRPALRGLRESRGTLSHLRSESLRVIGGGGEDRTRSPLRASRVAAACLTGRPPLQKIRQLGRGRRSRTSTARIWSPADSPLSYTPVFSDYFGLRWRARRVRHPSRYPGPYTSRMAASSRAIVLEGFQPFPMERSQKEIQSGTSPSRSRAVRATSSGRPFVSTRLKKSTTRRPSVVVPTSVRSR